MGVNIFDKYGIKQVANVYFEAIDDDIASNVYAGDIVLYLDTLKVSTIETTAENVAAQGGWGNPRLVSWDYGKEINITLEDALMSLESLRFMLGGAIKKPTTNDPVYIHHTEEVIVTDDNGTIPVPTHHLSKGKVTLKPEATQGHPIKFINLGGGKDVDGNPSTTVGARTQIVYSQNGTNSYDQPTILTFRNTAMGVNGTAVKGDHVRIFWDEEVTESNANKAIEITISPDTFPGTYRVIGDTFIRSEKGGKDEPFQFVIEKAKVLSEVTLTLEAEGDPSTFEMQLQVLRASGDSGNEMMKLIRYSVEDTTTTSGGDDIGSLGSGS